MTRKSQELLEKLIDSYRNTGKNEFDSFSYLGYSLSNVKELENEGYVALNNDVIESFKLTPYALNQ
uniref:Phage protein n=1 Tax=Dulem virus 35 TaxID=3145753 RepID=A0AAU8AYR4_9CAUD